jgi:hypothetical protein
MKRLNILTEGQTEEKFVWDLLAPHLANFEIVINARCIITGKTRQFQTHGNRQSILHKGGLIDFLQASRDLQRWRNEDPKATLTTMFDLYALPEDFPAYQATINQPAVLRVELLEEAFLGKVGLSNFIPYIQLHEFEALLFSDIQILNNIVARGSKQPEQTLEQLQEISKSFEIPELINDSPHTAPSKRLDSIFGEKYQKTSEGNDVAKEIGLEKIRTKCPHFNAWVTKLENI